MLTPWRTQKTPLINNTSISAHGHSLGLTSNCTLPRCAPILSKHVSLTRLCASERWWVTLLVACWLWPDPPDHCLLSAASLSVCSDTFCRRGERKMSQEVLGKKFDPVVKERLCVLTSLSREIKRLPALLWPGCCQPWSHFDGTNWKKRSRVYSAPSPVYCESLCGEGCATALESVMTAPCGFDTQLHQRSPARLVTDTNSTRKGHSVLVP